MNEDAWKAGQRQAQQGGSIPQQGSTPAQTYKDYVAGYNSNKK